MTSNDMPAFLVCAPAPVTVDSGQIFQQELVEDWA